MPGYLTIMQSQLWLVLAQHGCRSMNISFDQLARQALLDVVPPAGSAVSLTLAQHDRLLLEADAQLARRNSSLFAVAQSVDLSQLAGLCTLLCAKPTLGAACDYLRHNMSLAHPSYRGWLDHHDDGTTTFAFTAARAVLSVRQCHEQAMFGGLLNLLRQFPASDGVRLHKVIVSTALLQRFPLLTSWGLPLEVSDTFSGLRFDTAILARQAVQHSSGMERTLEQVFEATLAHDRIITSPASQVVDRVLARIEADQPVGLGDIAAELDIKPRTLQYYLGLEQVSFNYLRGRVQAHVACRLINAGHDTDEIVRRLGYSSRSAFHHAFTRITGLRPAQVRRGQVPQRDGVALASPPSTL